MAIKLNQALQQGLGQLQNLTNVVNTAQAVGSKLATTKSQLPLGRSNPTDEGDIIVSAQRLPAANETKDYRVRLGKIGAIADTDRIFGPNDKGNILYPLRGTQGLLFPYTPSIGFSQDVDWKSSDLAHTNYETASYARTPAVTLSLSGKFTVQTNGEGRYLLAVLHFLRVVSKMYFGREDAQTSNAGLPPPVLSFSGYGPYMFNAVKVIVKNHSYTIDDSVNLVRVDLPNGDQVRLPAILMLSLTLQVVQTPAAQKNEFNLDKFRTGELMRKGGGWI